MRRLDSCYTMTKNFKFIVLVICKYFSYSLSHGRSQRGRRGAARKSMQAAKIRTLAILCLNILNSSE
ncbi:hypothetical protein X975_03353, partial [Stegodyphus mimosarum]